MERLTTLDELRRHVEVLACIDETEASIVSVYLNLEQGEANYCKVLEGRVLALRSALQGEAHADFEAALHPIEAYLAEKLRPDAKGVAVFSRAVRAGAFFLPMQFAAPLPNWIAVYPTPNLFHLMALRDTYHRYVVLLATQASVRILEVDLGAATVQAWTEQPGLRERVGREWAKQRYQSHHRERTLSFLKVLAPTGLCPHSRRKVSCSPIFGLAVSNSRMPRATTPGGTCTLRWRAKPGRGLGGAA